MSQQPEDRERGTGVTAAPYGRPEVDDRGGVYSRGEWDPRTGPPQPVQPPPEDVLAAELRAKQEASGNIGQTESAELAQIIAAMQQQMAAMAAQISQLRLDAAATGEHPLVATARALRSHLSDAGPLESHAPAVQLADDLVDAAPRAVESGDLSAVKNIAARLEKWQRRHPVPPGESYHARQVADIIGYHLGDQVDSFVPRPKAPQLAGAAPVRVIEGSVTG